MIRGAGGCGRDQSSRFRGGRGPYLRFRGDAYKPKSVPSCCACDWPAPKELQDGSVARESHPRFGYYISLIADIPILPSASASRVMHAYGCGSSLKSICIAPTAP